MPRLATFELTRYRRELERALKRLPTDSGARPGLLGRLSEVLAEQESRERIANASVSRKSVRGTVKPSGDPAERVFRGTAENQLPDARWPKIMAGMDH